MSLHFFNNHEKNEISFGNKDVLLTREKKNEAAGSVRKFKRCRMRPSSQTLRESRFRAREWS
jgi:hypothetical protein